MDSDDFSEMEIDSNNREMVLIRSISNLVDPETIDTTAEIEEIFWKRSQSPVFMDDEDSRDSGYTSSHQGKSGLFMCDNYLRRPNEKIYQHAYSTPLRIPREGKENDPRFLEYFCENKESLRDDSPFTCLKAPTTSKYKARSPTCFATKNLLRGGVGMNNLKVPSPQFNRCLSDSEVGEGAILRAMQKAEENRGLIGDYSGSHALPLLENPKIHDLSCVNGQTVCDLLENRFEQKIANFALIDCRYPYEYVGGHIKKAVNIYTQERFKEFLDGEKFFRARPDENAILRRNVILFYCEYSKERGPGMCRFLREYDRKKNDYRYPRLDYPEIYLLDGGYKTFYANFKKHCEPQAYKPMDHEDHSDDLRKFRTKSKSWSSFGALTSSASLNAVGSSMGNVSEQRNLQSPSTVAMDVTPQKQGVLRRGLFKQPY